jgi:hypothetical protein
MKRIALSAIAIMAIAVAGASGCERAGPGVSAAPSGSSIRITQISPEPSSTLRVGDRVNLQVAAAYTLNAESGTVTLVVQAADNSSIANQWEVVPKGSGAVTLKASFVVPETGSIVVFTPLSAQGQGATSTVDSRAYKVVPK